MKRTAITAILVWCLVCGAAGAAGPVYFRVTFQPGSLTFSQTYLNTLSTSFSPAGPGSFTTTTVTSDQVLGYGTLYVHEIDAYISTMFQCSGSAGYSVTVQSLVTAGSGSGSGHEAQRVYAYEQSLPYQKDYVTISAAFSGSQSATAHLTGGSVRVSAGLTGGSFLIYEGGSRYMQMKVRPSFNLTDPELQLSADSTLFNTVSPGADASPETQLSVSNVAAAFVESLTIDYGDGDGGALSYSSGSNLLFTSTATHAFSLSGGEDSRSFVVSATAEGPRDQVPDDDEDTATMNMTLLRSPLAQAAIDGAAVPSGTIVDAVVGEQLAFDGSPSIGFIESVRLRLEGTELASASSYHGDADEMFQHTFLVPELPVGTQLRLEYEAGNSGSGANADTWGVTLNLVPEPGATALLGAGALGALGRRKRKSARGGHAR